ncbi:putative Yip1 domain-containing protein [Rosa chinensis]|uniref:Protein YIP n=1 Tax=Rosa chinensis TaxID=74649 RepID=A0A2P6SKV6_ROSCH|nr:protein YIPF1 homolog [Rosa chinensis]PRQ59293.1 putative Yip1 domain-containing protein [Rosa chinensis]
MDESYSGLPTSHLLGSVPAVVGEDKDKSTTSYEAPEANLQIFPPNSGGDRGRGGYQTVGGPSETFEEQPANNWRGVFNVASYTQYFNVDTDIVLNRLLSSLFPHTGDFFSKIDANPDLYGLIWICTTLVFVLTSLGNCATYLMDKHTDTTTSWVFNVSYMSLAACSVYGYAILVPLAFYFLLQYMGAKTSLVRFWCMWGYSLFIFVVASFLLLIPVEALRWIIIVLVGVASGSFVALNLKSYMEGSDFTIVVIAAFLLQLALAIFFKVYFFP